MAEPRRGFVLGKFMPPHDGHLFLCRTGISMMDQMTVLVCSTDEDPIPGTLRLQWIEDALPEAHILHLHRNLPQAPADHPDFWKIWTDVIHEMHPEAITHVFGSDRYIFKLAPCLDARPVLVDPHRDIFPVSGTAIRENPARAWRFLPPQVRRHYLKRICLLGPESTGKSVLAQTLAEHYHTRLMPEYGRTYDEEYKQTGAGERHWQHEELVQLAETHIAMRETLVPCANRVLIEDTDILQTAIWEQHLTGSICPEMSQLVASTQAADFYVILAPTVPFHDDGGRYFSEQETRTAFYQKAIALVKERKRPFVLIEDTDWQQREARALEAVTSYLGF